MDEVWLQGVSIQGFTIQLVQHSFGSLHARLRPADLKLIAAIAYVYAEAKLQVL